MKGPLFYSKILLFGEYGIIQDSKGLSIPYNFFNGALKIAEKPNSESKKSNNILADFCSYLKQFDELDLQNCRPKADQWLNHYPLSWTHH